MGDPACLTAELVLLKGCLKGPEPKSSVVMFVWLKEKQQSKASLERVEQVVGGTSQEISTEINKNWS